MKKDISSGYISWGGQHHFICYHSVFSVWFLLGRELVKSYSSEFLQWAGSINLVLAIFTWTAWGSPVNHSMSWFLYRHTVDCLESVLESKSIWELTQCVHIALWCIRRSGERLLLAWDLIFLACEMFMAMYVLCECVSAHLWECVMYFYTLSYCGFRALNELVFSFYFMTIMQFDLG